MKRRIQLTEQTLHKLVKESVKRMIKEDKRSSQKYLRRVNEEISEEILEELDEYDAEILENEGYSPYDFEIQIDQEIAEFHRSRKGYRISFSGEDFGEIWRDIDGEYLGNAEFPTNGYLFTFSGSTLNMLY